VRANEINVPEIQKILGSERKASGYYHSSLHASQAVNFFTILSSIAKYAA